MSLDMQLQASDSSSNNAMNNHYCDVIVIFFCGTTGNNCPELLGSDERNLVVIVWQLIDLNQNQVSTELNEYKLLLIAKKYCNENLGSMIGRGAPKT